MATLLFQTSLQGSSFAGLPGNNAWPRAMHSITQAGASQDALAGTFSIRQRWGDLEGHRLFDIQQQHLQMQIQPKLQGASPKGCAVLPGLGRYI